MNRTALFSAACVLLSLAPAFAHAQDDQPQPEKKKTPDVVFVPTPYDVVDRMLKTAGVNKDDLIYDLGCGDGRIVVTAAKKYGCKGVGVDLNPVRVKESNENAKKNGVEKLVTIREEDIFTVDLSETSVLALYLLPSMNVKLLPQIAKMKPGSRIVAHDYDFMGRVKPDKAFTMTSKEDGVEHEVFLWTTPLKVEPEGESKE